MPGPFPGMDPYLENPALWHDLHHSFITYTRDVLQPIVRPRYHVRIEERLYVAESSRSIYPDVALIEHAPPSRGEEQPAVTTMEWDAPDTTITLPSDEVSEGFLEIIDLTHGGELVTMIELLSPSNKRPGTEANRLYLQKQREVLSSEANLVEIDLLRNGEHTVAIPLEALHERGLAPGRYLVSIHRGSEPGKFHIYSRTVRERLPKIFIPLAEDDKDVALDLQTIFDRCYDNGYYMDLIDYGAAPAVSLQPHDATWVESLLKQKGLR